MNPAESDDDWAELARELSRDTPQTPAFEPDPTPLPGDEPAVPVDGGPEPVEAEVEPGFEPASEGESEGAPGTGRKRRRRRRRRRKGPGEPEAEALQTEEVDSGEAADGSEESEPGEIAGTEDEEESGESADDTDLVETFTDGDADESTGEELLRDLIASWNVPSWDDVVAGLYRPDR